MADLEFRFSADGAELEKLLSDVSNLKVNFIDLDEVNRALNSSFKNLASDVARFDDGLASASARAKQLHTDLEYIIGDINKIGFKDFDPTFGIEGKISDVGLGPELGSAFNPLQHPGGRNYDAYLKFLQGPDYDALYPPFQGKNITVASLNNRARNAARVEPSLQDIEALGKGIGRTEIVEWLDQVEEKAEKASRRLRGVIGDDESNGMRGIQVSGRKATLALVEFSRGAEDAAVTYGTGGLSGALRASINNFSQFAFILHPVAGAIAGVAGALTAAFLPAIIQATTNTDEFTKSLQGLGETLKDRELFNIDLSKIGDDATNSIKKLENELSRLDERERVTRATSVNRLLGTQFGGASTYESIQNKVGGFLGIDYYEQEAKNLERFGRLRAPDLEEFQNRVNRNVERGGGESSVAGFVEYLKQQGRITLNEDQAKELAGKLSEVEQELISIYRERKKTQELILVEERKQQKAAQRQSIEAEANRRKAEVDARTKSEKNIFDSLIKSVANTPEESAQRELYGQLEDINLGALNDSRLGDAAKTALRGAFNVRRNRDARTKEIDERIEALQNNPFRSLAGRITGAEELNKRITEAAGGYKDSTKEEIKKLREERKKADEEAKEELKKINSTLKEQLTEAQQKEVYGIVGP